jgi:hypothetical protein
MRRRILLVALTVFSLLLSMVAGCDILDLDFTMDLDYHTTVKASGDVIQEVRIEVTGMTDTMLEDAGFSGEDFLGEEGWDFDIESTDDSVVITGTADFILDEDGNIAQAEGGPDIPEGLSIRVEKGLLSTKYSVEYNAAGGGDALFGEDGETGALALTLLGEMIDFSWTIALPGSVVESNADVIEGGSATWNLDLTTMSSGLNLTMQSQYTNWPVIGGIIAGVVVVLVLVVVFFIMRRRRSTSAYLPGEIS